VVFADQSPILGRPELKRARRRACVTPAEHRQRAYYTPLPYIALCEQAAHNNSKTDAHPGRRNLDSPADVCSVIPCLRRNPYPTESKNRLRREPVECTRCLQRTPTMCHVPGALRKSRRGWSEASEGCIANMNCLESRCVQTCWTGRVRSELTLSGGRSRRLNLELDSPATPSRENAWSRMVSTTASVLSIAVIRKVDSTPEPPWTVARRSSGVFMARNAPACCWRLCFC